MSTANLQFNADIERFAKLLNDRLDFVLGGVAVALHSRLGDRTPYLTGRARASWNIAANEPDLSVAPELPFQFEDPFNPTSQELSQANAFYDPIFNAKNAYIPPKGATALVVSNNLFYIEDLNAGKSRQAPASFFEATVAGMELLINEQVAKLSSPF